MKQFYFTGKAAILWRTLSPAILLFAFVSYVFVTRSEKKQIVRPVVVVVEEGKFKRVAYHSADRANEIIAVDLAERFASAMWDYERDETKSYAKKYLDFSKNLEMPSNAAQRSKEFVEKVLKTEIKDETSIFVVDSTKTKALYEKGEWAVSIEGKRSIVSSSGSREETVELSTLLKNGEENEVFKIYDYRIRNKQ